MYKLIKFSFVNLILFLVAMNSVMAAEIKTTVDRNPVALDESFQITFTATESPEGDPDFSPLEQDFEILNQSQSSQSSWVNGQSSKSIKWILDVMAKEAGNMLIPVISFGDDLSQPLTIVINENNKSAVNSNNDEVFLVVEATPAQPFVQSQILYTLRLYRRVQITQASLTEPEMEDAIIEKLGEDKNYNTAIEGVAYVVTERKYAIFPQKSGVVTIDPLVLQAKIVTQSRPRFSGFFNSPATKTKKITSKAITLDVQAVPDNYNKQLWIPSEHLYIEEKWSGDTLSMKVGEPLTRTLTVLSKGSTVAQLPTLSNETELEDLKSYPDQPVLKEQRNTDGLIAFREEKIAYIPSNAGSYTLPEIIIPWFNTETRSMEIARIPERVIKVLPSTIKPSVQNVTAQAPDNAGIEQKEIVVQQVESTGWMWVSAGLALGWLITAYFLIRQRIPGQNETKVNPDQLKLKEIVKKLKKACAEDNKAEAKEALLAWGKVKLNSNNLSTMAASCEARLRDEILLLNENLYANQSKPWKGKKLFQYFVEHNAREKVSKKAEDVLEPLYKT